MEQLNERLASLRRRAGYSQEGLAERLGISRQAVSKWEGGQTEKEQSKMEQLNERLASLRRRAGYSQEGLAERLGISRQAVSKWEGGVSHS